MDWSGFVDPVMMVGTMRRSRIPVWSDVSTFRATGESSSSSTIPSIFLSWTRRMVWRSLKQRRPISRSILKLRDISSPWCNSSLARLIHKCWAFRVLGQIAQLAIAGGLRWNSQIILTDNMGSVSQVLFRVIHGQMNVESIFISLNQMEWKTRVI